MAAINLPAGRIIVDDFTYSALKNYPHLYPITYLNLISDLTLLSSSEVIKNIDANAAIARCDYMLAWKVVPQFRFKNLCAIKF